MNELIARLEALVACAIDITLGDPAAAPRDETSLMEALRAACAEAQDNPAEMLPVLEQLEARLDAALADAPEGVEQAATAGGVGGGGLDCQVDAAGREASAGSRMSGRLVVRRKMTSASSARPFIWLRSPKRMEVQPVAFPLGYEPTECITKKA